MGLQTFDETTPFLNAFPITSSNAPGTQISIAGATQTPIRIDAISLANSDTVVHNMELSFFQNATRGILGSVSVPAGAGYTTVPPVFAFATLLVAGSSGFVIPVNATLDITNLEAIGAGHQVDCVAFGGFL